MRRDDKGPACLKTLFDCCEKLLRNRCKCPVFIPDEIKCCGERRFQRPECEAALLRGVHKILECQEISEAFSRKHGAVIGEPERALQCQVFHVFAGPFRNIMNPPLSGAEEWKTFQIIYLNRFFGGEGVICTHDDSPDVRDRKCHGIIFPLIRRLGKNRKVQKTAIELVRDLLRITAGDVVVKARIAFLQATDLFCQ